MTNKNKALVTNTASAKQVEKAEQKAARKAKRDLEDMRAVLTTVEGRRVIWKILSFCKVFASPGFVPDSNFLYFNSGEQNVGRFVMNEITNADEGKLFQMIKENREAKGEDENE